MNYAVFPALAKPKVGWFNLFYSVFLGLCICSSYNTWPLLFTWLLPIGPWGHITSVDSSLDAPSPEQLTLNAVVTQTKLRSTWSALRPLWCQKSGAKTKSGASFQMDVWHLFIIHRGDDWKRLFNWNCSLRFWKEYSDIDLIMDVESLKGSFTNEADRNGDWFRLKVILGYF